MQDRQIFAFLSFSVLLKHRALSFMTYLGYLLRMSALLLCYVLSVGTASAQKKKHIIQFYGIVFHEDSLSGAIGAHIYHPSSYRGTSTDYYGYFSLPVAVGDTMRISYQGYKTQHITIPKVERDHYAALIYLQIDPIQLPEIHISPYMSEEQFKEAVLSLNSSGKAYPFLQKKGYTPLRTSYTLNYLYLVRQQQLQQAMRYHPNYVPATNLVLKPLIKAIKKKKTKK